MTDHIATIEERLKQLQGEVQCMEQQYGFSREFKQQIQYKEKPKEIKQNLSQKTQQQQQQQRYQNLPNQLSSQQTLKSQKLKPALSNKWVEVFSEKPSVMQFYSERYLPILQNPYDIQIKPSVPEIDQVFENYVFML